MKSRYSLTFRDYHPGHCWYYLLGGAVLSLKQIRNETRQSGYQGYAKDDIFSADNKVEPQRSAALRQLRDKFEEDLRQDLAAYRKYALGLHRYRAKHDLPQTPQTAAGVHVAISLKHNHLVNDFGHLILIDELLNRQGDLFGV